MSTNPISERAFPHNAEAERAVLGSILLDNGALNTASDTIGKGDFFSRSHHIIFEKMVGMSGRGRTINLVTLSEELSNQGDLERVGGATYLAALTDGVPVGSPASVTEYATIVREKAITRRLITASNNVIARCLESADSSDALVDLALSQIFEIAATEKEPSCSYLAAARATLVRLQRRDVPRILTGIKEIDF